MTFQPSFQGSSHGTIGRLKGFCLVKHLRNTSRKVHNVIVTVLGTRELIRGWIPSQSSHPAPTRRVRVSTRQYSHILTDSTFPVSNDTGQPSLAWRSSTWGKDSASLPNLQDS